MVVAQVEFFRNPPLRSVELNSHGCSELVNDAVVVPLVWVIWKRPKYPKS